MDVRHDAFTHEHDPLPREVANGQERHIKRSSPSSERE
jgi:hypothetical protein